MDPYIGEIRLFSFNFAPQNWLPCDGSAVSISTYNALYALVGVTYGGDGITTFGLPDLRGRIAIGMGQGTGLQNNYPLGAKAGVEGVTLTSAQIPSHNHLIQVTGAAASTNQPAGKVLGVAASTVKIYDSTPSTTNNMEDDMIANAGYPAPLAHNNVQPFRVLCYCICWNGVWPSHP